MVELRTPYDVVKYAYDEWIWEEAIKREPSITWVYEEMYIQSLLNLLENQSDTAASEIIVWLLQKEKIFESLENQFEQRMRICKFPSHLVIMMTKDNKFSLDFIKNSFNNNNVVKITLDLSLQKSKVKKSIDRIIELFLNEDKIYGDQLDLVADYVTVIEESVKPLLGYENWKSNYNVYYWFERVLREQEMRMDASCAYRSLMVICRETRLFWGVVFIEAEDYRIECA